MSKRLSHWLVIVALVAAPPGLCAEVKLGAQGLVLVNDDEEKDALDPDPPPTPSAKPAGWISRLVFGDSPRALVSARGQLEFLLRRKMESLTGVCALTEVQRQRLRLAGFGSIDSFFERVAAVERELAAGERDPQTARVRMLEAATTLRTAFRAGPFHDGWLFGKIVRKTLTPEQWQRYEALRFIEEAGGRLAVRDEGSGAQLQVYLASTTGTDAGLAHVRRFPNLQFLELDSASITDEGLSQLRECSALETLDVSGTQVTGAGLAHLARLTSLHWLDLHGTRVGDDGLPHLGQLF